MQPRSQALAAECMDLHCRTAGPDLGIRRVSSSSRELEGRPCAAAHYGHRCQHAGSERGSLLPGPLFSPHGGDGRAGQGMHARPSHAAVKIVGDYVLPVLPAGARCWPGGGCGDKVPGWRERRRRRAARGKVPPSLGKQRGGSATTARTLREGGSSRRTAFHSACRSHRAADQAFAPPLALATRSSWRHAFCVEPRLKIWTVQ